MRTDLWLYLSVAGILGVLLYRLIRILTSPLKDIPGPALARFSTLWYFRSIWSGQAHKQNIALHRKHASPGQFYAPIVRLGPNMYSITQPDKAIYGIASKMEKSTWYKGWQHPSPDRWTLFTDQSIPRHTETRRKFQSMYSMSSLLHYEPFVDDVQKIFRARLDEMATSGESVDMHHWLQCYAFDVIGMITYSQRFGFLDEGKDISNCMSSLQANMVYSTLVGVYPWAHPYLYYLMEKLPGTGAAARSYLMSFVSKRMADREAKRAVDDKAGKPKNIEVGAARDFLDIVMDAEQDPEKGMTKYNCWMMGISNIIAGSDTTAVSLSSIVLHLFLNPRVLASLRSELGQAIQEGKMTAESVTFKPSQDLPYLQACIKEGLRLWSATGLPLWRVVPKDGAQIMGRYFPEGTEVGINTWVAHYDEDVWGPDAGEYRPERWTEADKDRLRTMDSHFMSFGLGSRTCIGRHISYLEICKVIPMIVSLFDLELVDPETALEGENFWFVRQTKFKAMVKRRGSTAH